MKNKFLKWLAFKLRKQLTPYLPERIVHIYPIIPPLKEFAANGQDFDTLMAEGFIDNPYWKKNLVSGLLDELERNIGTYTEEFVERDNPRSPYPRVHLRLRILKPQKK